MWWVPLFAAALIGSVVLILQTVHNRVWRQKATSYRQSYLTLIQKIEALTLRLNGIEPLAPGVQDHFLLDYYESCLRLLENLLTMFKNIKPFGSEIGVLHSAHFLTKECQARVNRIEGAFRAAKKGKSLDVAKVLGRMTMKVPTGCYFCSRPFLYAGFSRVKVRMEAEIKQVYSCDVCKDALKAEKKVRVLFFLKDQKPVHWSEVSDYNPINDYWNINKKTAVMEKRKLELIQTMSEEIPFKD